jgi:hypothetical protein
MQIVQFSVDLQLQFALFILTCDIPCQRRAAGRRRGAPARARADILKDILGYFVHLLHQSDIL